MNKKILSIAIVTVFSTITAISPIAHAAGPKTVDGSSFTSGRGFRTGGAAETGVYPNSFAQADYSQKAINSKIETAWNTLFNNSVKQPSSASELYNQNTVYYQMTPDMAYIEDIANGDVRTEGMGYGMMIAVQLNHKQAFDALWNYAKTYMQIKSGPKKNYFDWHVNPDGSAIDANPGVAPDGDQWIAAALLFASDRWGNNQGNYDYKKEAKTILHTMWHQSENGGVNMFDPNTYLPVFSPGDSPNAASSFTDPSYNLPAFYRIFAKADPSDKKLWEKATVASEQLIQNAANPSTGLTPDYSYFNGNPYANFGANHANAEYDAYRTIANASVDAAWFGVKPWETQYANTLENFYVSKSTAPGQLDYGNNWTLDGSNELAPYHSAGLVAMNASSAIEATNPYKVNFVNDLWNTGIPSGQYRYYDGVLYMLGLLYSSGEFKIWYPPYSKRHQVNDQKHQQHKR